MTPLIRTLGDSALLVRFGDALDEEANRAAIGFADKLTAQMPEGVLEIAPNLVSVLLRYDPVRTDSDRLAAELRLLLNAPPVPRAAAEEHFVPVTFGGSDGPDLPEVAAILRTTTGKLIAAHNATPLRVLAVGFAPGFVYCGFHPPIMRVPRRTTVRQRVPAGSILFAAGQTAIAATEIPTGWHVIGRTRLINFDPAQDPPVTLMQGDRVRFEVAP